MTSVTPRKKLNDHLFIHYLKIKASISCLLHLKEVREIKQLRRKHQGMQLRSIELLKIVRAIKNYEDCKLLIFGLGFDSPFWNEVNKNGRTRFLEDHPEWLEKIKGKYPALEAHQVTYPRKNKQWAELIDRPDLLQMELPKEIGQVKWDVILVDGPQGHNFLAETPGRMSSIYMASQLVSLPGYVYVHDAQRSVENLYAKKYLQSKRLVEQVYGRALMLIFYFN